MNYFFKIIMIVCTATLFCQTCFVKSSYAKNRFEGPYISLGVINLIRSDTIEMTSTSNGFRFFRGFSRDNAFGLAGAAGYRWVKEKYLLGLGGEFRYVPDFSQGVLLGGVDSPRVSTKGSAALMLRPGILVAPSVALSGILGVDAAYYKVRYLFNSTNAVFSGWQLGPTIGLGVDMALSKKLILQFDYRYSFYHKLYYNDTGNTGETILYPRANMVLLSLNYRFT